MHNIKVKSIFKNKKKEDKNNNKIIQDYALRIKINKII